MVMMIPDVQAGLLEDALSPLEGLSVPLFYARFSGIIDAVVFMILFTGLAQMTIGRKFEGKGGRAIVAGTGLVLTLGLLLAKKSIGFSIASFGPAAAGMVVVLFAAVLFLLLRKLGVGGSASFSVGYLAVYFMMQAVVPGFFAYLKSRAGWLHALLALGAFVSMALGAWTVVSRIKIGKLPRLPSLSRKSEVKADSLEQELGAVAKLRVKDSDAIVADLNALIAVIEKHGDTAEVRALVSKKLREEVMPKEHRLRKALRVLRRIQKKVENLELGKLVELKKAGGRKAVAKRLQELRIDEKIGRIAKSISDHDKYFRKQLAEAADADSMEELRNRLIDAREAEKAVKDLDYEIERLIKLLRKISNEAIA